MHTGRFGPRSTPEVNDGVPIASTVFVRPPTIQEMIQRYVRDVISEQAVDDGEESFDDADDFEMVDDEALDFTHHQVVAMSDEELRGVASGYGVDLIDDRQVPQEGGTPRAPTGEPANGANGASGARAQAPQESPP